MSRLQAKRKADAAGIEDKETSSRSLPPPSGTNDKNRRSWQTLSSSRSSPGKGIGVLKFEPGASIVFKVFQAIIVLLRKDYFTVDEQLTQIFDATAVLHEAREAFGDQQHEVVPKEDLNELQRQLDAARDDPELEYGLRQRLQELQHEPVWIRSKALLEEWYQEALALMTHAEVVTEKYDIGDDLRHVRNRVNQTYHQCLHRIENQTLFTDATSTLPADSSHQLLVRDVYIKHFLMSTGQESPVRHRLANIHQLYVSLYNIMKETRSDLFAVFSIYDLAEVIHSVTTELQDLLCRHGKMGSLKDQSPTALQDVLCQGHCHALVTGSEGTVKAELANMFQNLQDSVRKQPILELECEFTNLANLIDSFATQAPIGVADDEWIKYAPRMLMIQESRNIMNKLQYLHTAFQNKAYARSEIAQLWLAIWRGLKATYLIVREKGFNFDEPSFPVEAIFFKWTTVRNQFELVLSMPEARNPEVIENIVAEYCILIAECLRSTSLEYGMLKLLQADKVPCTILKSISDYAETRKWNEFAIRGTEKCAVRLNSILEGPTFVRRLGSRSSLQSESSVSLWGLERVVLKTERLCSSPSSPGSAKTPRAASQPGLLSASSTGASSSCGEIIVRRLSTDTHDRSRSDRRGARRSTREALDDGLASTDVISAFDYVAYPFPETRALEVALSRQITREMSQSGIYSRGALEEDVINRPPRHTWPPGAISIWAQPLPVDPVSILKELWSTWRNGKPNTRRLQRSRPCPSITLRRPRKEWADEHPRLRPLRDIKNRVSRFTTTTKQAIRGQTSRQYSDAVLPKLRGGGPKSSEGTSPQEITSKGASPTDENRLTDADKLLRLQVFRNRILGFWRGGELPSASTLCEYFLIPWDWDVDAAHAAMHRFCNAGILEDSPVRPNVTGSAALKDDPFRRLGVNAGIGMNPTTYGIPAVRDDFVPEGLQYSGSTSTSPTPQARRTLVAREEPHLDPLLQAHLIQPEGDVVPELATGDIWTTFATSGLPAPIQIWEDSPGRRSPVPQPFTPPRQSPAPNQEHQAQIERQQAGLPPRNSDDNSSNQENTSPRHPFPVNLPASSSHHIAQAVDRTCEIGICHPCPRYTGLFHHICRGQEQPLNFENTPVLPTQQLPASSLFVDLGITQSTSRWQPEGSGQASGFRPRPAVNDDNPSPLVSEGTSSSSVVHVSWPPPSNDERAAEDGSMAANAGENYLDAISTERNAEFTSTLDLSNENPSSPVCASSICPGGSTEVAGYSLRNRSALARQRASKEAKDRAFEHLQTTPLRLQSTPEAEMEAEAKPEKDDAQPNSEAKPKLRFQSQPQRRQPQSPPKVTQKFRVTKQAAQRSGLNPKPKPVRETTPEQQLIQSLTAHVLAGNTQVTKPKSSEHINGCAQQTRINAGQVPKDIKAGVTRFQAALQAVKTRASAGKAAASLSALSSLAAAFPDDGNVEAITVEGGDGSTATVPADTTTPATISNDHDAQADSLSSSSSSESESDSESELESEAAAAVAEVEPEAQVEAESDDDTSSESSSDEDAAPSPPASRGRPRARARAESNNDDNDGVCTCTSCSCRCKRGL